MVAAVELLPSWCAIVGGALPDGAAFDGENLSAAWFGRPAVRAQPLFWEQGRNATFKSPSGRDRSPNLAVREGEWKLLLNADGSGVELYDAIADRAEKLDLAAVKPEFWSAGLESACRYGSLISIDLPTARSWLATVFPFWITVSNWPSPLRSTTRSKFRPNARTERNAIFGQPSGSRGVQ